MPRFAYEALDPRGRVIAGTVEAPDLETVIDDLKTSKYTVTNIKQQQDIFSFLTDYLRRLQRVSLYALAVFTRQFATLFNSGMPLIRGLEALSRQTVNKKLTLTIAAISHDVKSGYSLSKALSRHPDVFSPVYISLVKAGEMAGALGEVLERIAELMEKESALRRKVSSSMVYPIFVFVFATLVTLGLVFYIFPKFMEVLQGINVALPIPTKILIFVTNQITNPFFVTVALITGFILAIVLMQYLKTPLGKKQKDRLLLDLPLIGRVNSKVIMSRFCRTLGTLLASGVPLIHAMEIVSRAAGNEVVSAVIEDIKSGLKAGMRLSQPLREHKIFPPMVSQMVAVGEETGNLSRLLDKLANFYDMEVEHALGAFASMIEPIMILIIGGMVGFVLMAVFMPIYRIIERINV